MNNNELLSPGIPPWETAEPETAGPDRELAELLKDARAWLGMYANERTIRKHSETAFRLGQLCGKIDKVLSDRDL